MYTLTTRKGTPDKLQLRYAETTTQITLKETQLSPMIGVWVEVVEQIEIKKTSMLTLPSKISNHKKVMKEFLKISENPGQFYESLEYQNKRVFQNILFPEGFRFSMKNKECRTSKLNILFDLTSSFSKTYDTKKEKTQTQKVLESHLVAPIELFSKQNLDFLLKNSPQKQKIIFEDNCSPN